MPTVRLTYLIGALFTASWAAGCGSGNSGSGDGGADLDSAAIDAHIIDGNSGDGLGTDGPVGDGPVIDAPTADSDIDAMIPNAPTIAVQVLELHGQIAPSVSAMAPTVGIHVYNVSDQIDHRTMGLGCGVSEFNVSGTANDAGVGGPPPDTADYGTITITGYSGRGSAMNEIASQLVCTRGSTGTHDYSCTGLPTQPILDSLTPEFLVPKINNMGDDIRFQISGGPISNGRPLDITTPASGEMTIDNAAAIATWDPSQPLNIMGMKCIGNNGMQESCGAPGVFVISVISSDVMPGAAKSHWVEITCTKAAFLSNPANLMIEPEFTALINNTPWRTVSISISRVGPLGQPGILLGGPQPHALVAGPGQFFTVVHP